MNLLARFRFRTGFHFLGLLCLFALWAIPRAYAVPPGNPSTSIPDVTTPCITHNGLASPDPSFVQVKTGFGPASAVEDKRTRLMWLHLNFTAGMSYERVKAEMAPGGRLAGWRYATPDELREFFSHYDGAPNGYSKNPALEARLQCDLGGPLGSFSNPENGFHRTSSVGFLDVPFDLGHANFGYIADDNFTGPVIDPKLQGSTRDTFAIAHIASYLVREDRPGWWHRFWHRMPGVL